MSTPSTKIIPALLALPESRAAPSISSGRPFSPRNTSLRIDPDRVGERGVELDPLVVAVDGQDVPGLDELSISLISSA